MDQRINKRSIRFRAAAVFLHEGKILVHAVKNRSDGKMWFIPPGGGINYGESSRDALVREIKEELEWEIEVDGFLGVFESFHIINGVEEHEVSFVYAARATDRLIRTTAEGEIHEADGPKKFRWIELEILMNPKSFCILKAYWNLWKPINRRR